MRYFSKLLYKIGGYDYKIIEKIEPVTSHFGLKYLIPGFSLLIVFFTASYGGWHFSETLISDNDTYFKIKHILGTFFFAFFVFFIDYIMLNSPRNNWMLYLRGAFSITIGVLVGLLTTISFFSYKINSNLEKEKNDLIKPIKEKFEGQIKDKEEELKKQDTLALASRNKAEAEADGTGGSQKRGTDTIYRLKLNNYRQDTIRLSELKSKITSDTIKIGSIMRLEIEEKEKEFDTKSSLSQMKSLWSLMNDKSVVLFSLIFFFGVTLADLIPLFAKISRDYSEEYDPYKNFIESLKDKIKVQDEDIHIDFTDIESIRRKNDFELSKFNEEALQKINSLYALEKYQELLEYFKNRGVPEEAIAKIFAKLQKEANNSEGNEG